MAHGLPNESNMQSNVYPVNQLIEHRLDIHGRMWFFVKRESYPVNKKTEKQMKTLQKFSGRQWSCLKKDFSMD